MNENVEERLTEQNDMLIKLLKNNLNELKKYFDSVQILATKHEGDSLGTSRFTVGVGDFYARIGLAKIWVENESLNDRDNLTGS